MNLSVDHVLAERLALRSAARRWPSMVSSVALHGLLVTLFLIGPVLLAGPPRELEFVPVQLVPLQALGVPSPEPARPEPEPAPRAPEAPRETVSPKPAPTLPDPDAASETPEPRRETERPAAPRESAPAREQRRGSPFGSSLGTSAFGATVGAFDNPDFTYGYYVDQMLSMISSNWNRPAIGGSVEVEIYFRIHRRGDVTDVRVNRSSGYNSFDLNGLRAVRLAAPFPPLPDSYPHGSLGVTLIMR